MKASELRELIASAPSPNKTEQSGHTTITLQGPKGEKQMFIIRDTSTEEYYKILDAFSQFKYEVDKGRRGSVEDAKTLRTVQQSGTLLGERTEENGEVPS